MRKISDREAKAMGYAIADEILTRAELYRSYGMGPVEAINAAMEDMAG